MTHAFLPWHPTSTFRYVSTQLVIGSVGLMSKIALKRHNVEIFGYEKLEKHVLNRNGPAITISNHLSTLDDPLLFGILPFSVFIDPKKMRIVPGAQELTFDVNSYFFNSGGVVPVKRGHGIWQKGVDHCVNKLNDDGWIHLYPEGKVNQNIDQCIRWKWGISRLVMECKKPVTVIPFAHRGLEKLMPLRQTTRENINSIPTAGGVIEIAFGDPVDYADVLLKCRGSKDVDSRIMLTCHFQNQFERFRQTVWNT
eukprot:NODE_96_length_21330_cov_0.419858.p6 type:complete len:253 gc:universal NODE_96_length_21330_cov_0.419858:17293-16535(-)